MSPANTARFIEMLASKDSGIRYWGTIGLLMLGKADATTQAALEGVLHDDCGEVRAMASWVLIHSGNPAKARATLADLVQAHTPATLIALNAIDWSHDEIAPYVSAMDALANGKQPLTEYELRMVEFLRESHGLPNPTATEGALKRRQQKELKKDL